MALITLKQAKQHVKSPLDIVDEDADLQLKLEIAEQLVLDYVKQNREDNDAWATTVDAWTALTAPKQVLGAILVQFAELYRFRGDDEDLPARPMGVLCPQAMAMVYRLRDPAVA